MTLSSHAAVLERADNEAMERIDRPLLTLVCPGCGVAFPSARQMEPRTFEAIRLSNLLELPEVLAGVRFNKPDYLSGLKVEGRTRRASGEGILPVVRRPPDRLGPPRNIRT
jgi:hypothetical protein